MKILTTALFSVVLLKRKLSMIKWASLFFLAVGVAIVQLQAVDSNTKSKSDSRSMDPLIGSLAVAAACFTSGLAGVYFEMVLKGSKADLWVRNVQLSAFSILPALCPAFFPNLSLKAFLGLAAPLDTIVVSKDAWMFSGFGFWAWSVVLCQVFGGLITALVIKFSDNIMKVRRTACLRACLLCQECCAETDFDRALQPVCPSCCLSSQASCCSALSSRWVSLLDARSSSGRHTRTTSQTMRRSHSPIETRHELQFQQRTSNQPNHNPSGCAVCGDDYVHHMRPFVRWAYRVSL